MKATDEVVKAALAEMGVDYSVRKHPARWPSAATAPIAKPAPPTAASVLNSLLLDGAAVDQSFPDWCGDFGYDEDSITALGTYRACCKTGRLLRSLFTPAQREQLETLLQDY